MISMNNINKQGLFDHIALFYVDTLQKNASFNLFYYYYWTHPIRLRVLQLLDDPNVFVPNESVSKELYEQRYNVLRVLCIPEDPNFDGDYSSVPISSGFFRISDSVEIGSQYWQG